MNVELGGLIVAAVGAIITFVLSYRDEAVAWKRRYLVAGLVCTALGGLFALELKTRSDGVADSRAALDRRWILLQDAPIESVELELIRPDGATPLATMLKLAGSFTVSLNGIQPGSTRALPGKSQPIRTLALASLFSLDDIGRRGGLGIARVNATVEKDRNRDVRSFTCMTSRYITETVLSATAPNSQLVCAVKVTVPLPMPQPVVRSLDNPAATIDISRRTWTGEPISCTGPCLQEPLLSVRLMTKEAGLILPSMLEISPYLYRVPVTTDGSRNERTRLRGPDALRLLESRFKESFGFLDRQRFAFTKGLVNYALRRFTTRERAMRFIDVVMINESSPPNEALMDAIPPAARRSAEAFRVDEWCGFGERSMCWTRFALFDTQPQ
jgi:hypothetical protein